MITAAWFAYSRLLAEIALTADPVKFSVPQVSQGVGCRAD